MSDPQPPAPPTAHERAQWQTMREALADYAHEAWAGWMRYLFRLSVGNADGSVTIPAVLVARWQRQMDTPYPDLPSEEQASDLKEADDMLATADVPRLLAALATTEGERGAARYDQALAEEEAATWRARALAMNAQAAEAAFFDSLMNDPPPGAIQSPLPDPDAPVQATFNEGSCL